jgi:anti-sigma-K factor RskA
MSGHLPQQHTPADDCAAALELLPAYSLGATDPEETRFVERMLALCPEAVAELRTWQGLNDALIDGTPKTAPPPTLRAGILAAIAAQEQAASTTPTDADTARRVEALMPRPPAQSTRFALRPAWIAAGAAAALLIISNLYWLSEVNNLRQREESILALMQRQDALLTAFGAGETQRLELAAADPTQPGAVSVVWSPAEPLGLVTARDLPTLDADRTYQFWLIGSGQPISGGTFSVDADGRAVLVFESGVPIDSFAAFGITTEPAGGSPAPTMNPLYVGELS